MTIRETPAARAMCLVSRRLSDVGDQPALRRSVGVILFADIAGFTAMTEAARRRGGERGIEQLTRRLNGIFTALVAAVHQAGGDILKFGGDALLVAFDDDTQSSSALARAVWCADRLARIIRVERRRSGGRLDLHLGIACGDWNEILAGRPGERREHFVHGRCIRLAMDAAGEAQLGECFLAASGCRLCLGVPVYSERIRRGMWRLEFPKRSWDLEASGCAAVTQPSGRMLDFVPRQLRAHLEQAGFDPLAFGEHRRVSTLFVFWRPPSPSAGELALWQEVHAVVLESAEVHNGLWARSDPGGDYQKVLMLFGATTSAEDDVNRALACASFLRDRLTQVRPGSGRLRFGMGLTTATVFAGWVGGPDRHEFTVMGDGVNLAARLAARAPSGSVLTDRGSTEVSRGWRFAAGPQMQLKGVRGLVTGFRLVAKCDGARGDEQDDIVQHPVAMEEALRHWEDSANRALTVDFQPPADARPFVAQLLRRLGFEEKAVPRFRFVPADGRNAHGGLQRFLLWCAGAESEGRIPDRLSDTLSGAMRAELSLMYGAPNRIARVLTQDGPDAWIERAAQMVEGLGVLKVAFERHPLVVLEQAQYLSDLDRRLFARLASSHGLRPRFVIVRQASTLTPDAGSDNAVRLGAITKGEMQRCIGQLLPQGTLSVQLLEWLHERSGGIARVARLYLEHLQRNGLVVRRSGKRTLWHLRAADAPNLPDVLRVSHLARIDALPNESGLVARVLAVLGDGAPHAALQSICATIMTPVAFEAGLQGLWSQGIVEQSGGAAEILYSYSDVTCRSAVYDTLSYATREQWHRLAAQYWRTRGRAGSVNAAEHLFCARDQRCLPALERAARNARRLWLLDRSRHLYRWALLAASDRCDPAYAPVLPPLPGVLDEQSRRLLKQFAEVLHIQGVYPEARRIYRRLSAEGAKSRRLDLQGESLLAVARIDWLSGRYAQALRLTARVLRIVACSANRVLEAHAYLLMGETARRTGGMRRAQRALERSVQLLQRLKDAAAKADALNALGLVHWSCGRLDEAQQCFATALRSSRGRSRTTDPAKRGQIANNLGILMEERGRLRLAERYYRKAFAVFNRLGHRRNRAYSQGNLANLYRHAARYEQARAAYEDVEWELASIGEQHAAAYTVGNRGDLLRDFGDFDGAAELYHKTMQFARQVGDADLIAESYCRLAQIQIGKRRLAEAARLATLAAAAAEKAASREFALRARLISAEIRFEEGETTTAHDAFEQAEQEASQAGLQYYLLWAMNGLGRCLSREKRFKDASRLGRQGLRRAHRSGYVWWKLQFAILGAMVEREHASSPPAADSGLQQAACLKSAIEGTIGDPAIRLGFSQLPIVRTITDLGIQSSERSAHML